MALRPVPSDASNHIAESPPAALGHEQRRAELASILAAGVIRHLEQRRRGGVPAASLIDPSAPRSAIVAPDAHLPVKKYGDSGQAGLELSRSTCPDGPCG